jgi:hypothetical protein
MLCGSTESCTVRLYQKLKGVNVLKLCCDWRRLKEPVMYSQRWQQKTWSPIWRRTEPGTPVLAKARSNLTDRPILLQLVTKVSDYYPKPHNVRSVDYWFVRCIKILQNLNRCVRVLRVMDQWPQTINLIRASFTFIHLLPARYELSSVV